MFLNQTVASGGVNLKMSEILARCEHLFFLIYEQSYNESSLSISACEYEAPTTRPGSVDLVAEIRRVLDGLVPQNGDAFLLRQLQRGTLGLYVRTTHTQRSLFMVRPMSALTFYL